jgi:hypothetical protein
LFFRKDKEHFITLCPCSAAAYCEIEPAPSPRCPTSRRPRRAGDKWRRGRAGRKIRCGVLRAHADADADAALRRPKARFCGRRCAACTPSLVVASTSPPSSYGPLGACHRWFRLIPFHFTPHHFTAQPSNPYMPWPSNFLQRDKLAQHTPAVYDDGNSELFHRTL